MKTISFVGFDLIENHKSYLGFIYIFDVTQFELLFCFESEDKYYDSKIKITQF